VAAKTGLRSACLWSNKWILKNGMRMCMQADFSRRCGRWELACILLALDNPRQMAVQALVSIQETLQLLPRLSTQPALRKIAIASLEVMLVGMGCLAPPIAMSETAVIL